MIDLRVAFQVDILNGRDIFYLEREREIEIEYEEKKERKGERKEEESV